MDARSRSGGGGGPGGRSVGAIVAALLLAAFGFLPIAHWTSTGLDGSLYASLLSEWWSGTTIAVGAGLVLAILSRHIRVLWVDGWAARADAVLASPVRRRALEGGVAVLAALGALALAAFVLGTRPILIDEIAQVRQAQIFAHGNLWLPAPPYEVFVSSLQMVDAQGRVYSQYPPGGPALLALGQLVDAPWIVDPVFSALSVVAFASLLRIAEPRPRVAMGALVLFATAPFTLFMAASHMNHVTTLAWLLVASAALATAMDGARPRPGLAALSGAAFGIAATIRPVDALAFAVPAAVWYLARALLDPVRWRDALAAAAGVALPIAAMLATNEATTGHALRFGYEVLWGPGHTLGFHRAPWGEAHTPGRGLALVNLYVLRLQRYLFETPIPSLLPAIVALALARRLRAVDRYLLVSGTLLLGLYFAYFHDGFYRGPRFVYPLIPVLALWTARCPAALREHLRRDSLAYRAGMYALAVSAAIAVLVGIPTRAAVYAASGATERWSTPHVAADAGVRHALVFVRESWDAQLVARMWALGVSHGDAEWLNARVDGCRLALALDSLERLPAVAARPFVASAALRSLARDSALVSRQDLALGIGVRMQRGFVPAPLCVERVREMMQGVTPLAPLLVLDDGNVYARDLQTRDTVLLHAYPDRPVYLLRDDGVGPDARPRFYPAARAALVAQSR